MQLWLKIGLGQHQFGTNVQRFGLSIRFLLYLVANQPKREVLRRHRNHPLPVVWREKNPRRKRTAGIVNWHAAICPLRKELLLNGCLGGETRRVAVTLSEGDCDFVCGGVWFTAKACSRY